METHRIALFEACYRLPARAASQRDRLDRVMRQMLELTLETAVARLGIPASEHVCVRRVDAPARLRLGASDDALAAAWSLAVADGLAAAIARGGDDVVRYGSRAHALTDLLAGVAAGDTTRAWAWRQLDLYREGDGASDARAIEQAIGALERAPELIAPQLAEAARNGSLPRLARRLGARGWSALARAALAAARLPVDLAAPGGDDVPATPAARRYAEQAARGAAIGPCVAPLLSRADAAALRALAVLSFLEVDPGALRAGAARARLAALEALLGEVAADRRGGEGPARDAPPPEARRRDLTAARDGADARRERGAHDGAAARRPGSPPAPPEAHAPAAERAAAPLPESRRRGATRAGGLLFLLHLVGELALADAALADEVLAARPLRWSLHQLALALAPIAADDAAALAFAGLRPGDAPPSAGAEPPGEDELAAVAGLASRVRARLRERLGRLDEPEERVLRSACRRDAEIIADPGWIELHLSLDDAATDIRRAGLDLDPGWMPWLGVVVRFFYD